MLYIETEPRSSPTRQNPAPLLAPRSAKQASVLLFAKIHLLTSSFCDIAKLRASCSGSRPHLRIEGLVFSAKPAPLKLPAGLA